MKIYLIEDDDIYAEFIRRSLAQNPDVQVEVFRTAEDCLQAIDGKALPDAFIVDYKLPGKSGIEFYDAVKGRLNDNQRLIMMSAIDDGAMVLNFIRKGVRDYVIKDEQVVESLKAILEGKDEDYYLFS
jgi:DNA-binding NarL/FixJ family response regulator